MAEDRTKAVQLPADRSNHVVQVLGHSSTDKASGTVSGTTSSIAVPTGAEIVEVGILADAHIVFGDSDVEATTSDPVFPKGAAVYKLLPGQTHLAAILAAGASSAAYTITRLK